MELRGAVPRRPPGREPHLRRPRSRPGRLSRLTSAPPPAPGPEDHARGRDGARIVLAYTDYECPYCAAVDRRLRALDVRVVHRHFPVRSKHPRAWAASAAAEAAALQGAFWPMHDALFADQGRLEDPHLWARAGALGLDVERFDADRRSERVLARIKVDFQGGVRAGVASTPTLLSAAGERLAIDQLA